jgi:hypothetical protein
MAVLSPKLMYMYTQMAVLCPKLMYMYTQMAVLSPKLMYMYTQMAVLSSKLHVHTDGSLKPKTNVHVHTDGSLKPKTFRSVTKYVPFCLIADLPSKPFSQSCWMQLYLLQTSNFKAWDYTICYYWKYTVATDGYWLCRLPINAQYCKPWNFRERFIFEIFTNALSNANLKRVKISTLMH